MQEHPNVDMWGQNLLDKAAKQQAGHTSKRFLFMCLCGGHTTQQNYKPKRAAALLVKIIELPCFVQKHRFCVLTLSRTLAI